MPLIQSKSDKAFKSNIKAEIAAGKPQKQAVAIAYSTKRMAKKATGGSTSPYDYDSDVDYYQAMGRLKDEDESVEPERTAIQKYKDKKYVNRIIGQEKVGNIAKAMGDKETAEKMAGRKQRRLESSRLKDKAESASKQQEYGKATRTRKEWSEKIGKGKPAPFKTGGSSCW
jgi:hypothetical protein